MTDSELRDLDRRVALALGDRWVPDNPDLPDGDGWWISKDGFKYSISDGGPAEYSTCWKAMGRLIDRLTSESYVKVRLESTYWHGEFCSITAPDPTQRDDNALVKVDALNVWGEKLPVAVCLATLKALETL